jgi:pimeloyl-ACP methyl ester carboxylesterase
MTMIAQGKNSTTVRSKSGTAPRLVRAGLGALEAVAPDLASLVALRLFLRAPRPPARAWSEAPPHAEPFALRAAGETVRGIRLGDGPAVLLVHGWGGWGAQLSAFAAPLVDEGCAVVWYDGPGHGASSGRSATIPQLAEAATAVARAVEARAVIAHSAGGAAVALALGRGLGLDAAVLVAPPRGPEAFFERFCAATGLATRTRALLRERLERRAGMRMADLQVSRIATRLGTPALVVHDRGDREIPWSDGAEVALAWPDARFRMTEGLGHRRVLRDRAVIEEATGFVLSRLARCECGRLAQSLADGAPRCETCSLALHLADRASRAPEARPRGEMARSPPSLRMTLNILRLQKAAS